MTKQDNFDALKTKHPNWNDRLLLWLSNRADDTISWTLLETPCPKCSKQLGEHDYNVIEGLRCPKPALKYIILVEDTSQPTSYFAFKDDEDALFVYSDEKDALEAAEELKRQLEPFQKAIVVSF